MKIGIVGPSAKQRSAPFDAQRSINFFPVLDEQGKETASLYGTPGLLLFGTAGTGPIRGSFKAANGRAFVVSGSGIYEIDGAGAATLRGSLDQSQGNISIDENGFQLAICDGASVYIFTYATNAYQKVTDPDIPIAGTICFIDGYFVVNKVSTGQFYISALYDGLSWGPLDFATAESSPDELLRVFNATGQLWLLGTKTGEIWTNTGNSVFPFERISGAKMETGIAAPYTAVAIDNTIIWVGQNDIGNGTVYRARGFTPQRISTEPIEILLRLSGDLSEIKAWAYQEDGHVHYVLTGGNLETSPTLDLSTNIWHERAFLNEEGEFEQHLGSCCMFAFGKQLIGDRKNGNIYEMSLDYFDDNGAPLCAERTYTHISDEDKRLRMASLTIGFETGVGTQTGQGYDPKCELYISRDGSRTWSDGRMASIGKAGEYRKRVIFRRLGMAREITFRLRITDPVKRCITGSYLT